MDIHQQHKPRMLASLPEVYFDRPDLDAQFNEFATDIRPQITDLETWDMRSARIRCKQYNWSL